VTTDYGTLENHDSTMISRVTRSITQPNKHYIEYGDVGSVWSNYVRIEADVTRTTVLHLG